MKTQLTKYPLGQACCCSCYYILCAFYIHFKVYQTARQNIFSLETQSSNEQE